jgi:hypothetical protein
VIWPNIRSASQDSAGEAAQPHGHQDHRQHGQQPDPRISRQVDVGGHSGQVEADQHHDRAGDDWRQHPVDGFRAEHVDHHADQRQYDTGDQDRAGDVGRPPALGVDGAGAADERR